MIDEELMACRFTCQAVKGRQSVNVTCNTSKEMFNGLEGDDIIKTLHCITLSS